ncbi:hypothetical protein DAPPUDRAFT_336682, partial [Daphnia pulex]
VPHTYTLYTSTPDPVHISSLSFYSPLIDFNTLDVRDKRERASIITGSNIQREHLVLRTGDSNLVSSHFPVVQVDTSSSSSQQLFVGLVIFKSSRSLQSAVHLVNNSLLA